jgi:hypothetical protein
MGRTVAASASGTNETNANTFEWWVGKIIGNA